ncbi:hypothetical protein SK069_05670 [Patulibacter brassicae]|uniref:Uncharacterized protein n=1 Tax=Patulibacter brassicae TaxID=1705717 RepID=A0ABU4VGX1_9ACTN|nr:hypothetical protein [Patulibacter brassicae]MDX8151072.1 hypothetical protein [Patulibacter brassicae]
MSITKAGLGGPSKRITVTPTEQPNTQPAEPARDPAPTKREKEPVPA